MDVFSHLAEGFAVALTIQNIGLAIIGCVLGTIFGALPGLGPANGVAILIPLSFALGLPPASAMILLCSVYYGAMYGGRSRAVCRFVMWSIFGRSPISVFECISIEEPMALMARFHRLWVLRMAIKLRCY